MAIEIPGTVISMLKKVQADLKAHDFGIRWVAPENMHLTLKFLGDIESSEDGKIGDLAESAIKGFEPVTLCVSGTGAFPNIKRPRVVWAGISGQTEILDEIRKRLDIDLEPAGIPMENKPFKGHLTLGRVKKTLPEEAFVREMEKHRGLLSEFFRADRITFFKSDLTSSGPIYTKIRTFFLGS